MESGHLLPGAPSLHAQTLGAVPKWLRWLFGAVCLCYAGARSFDKWRGPVR